jgi:hypothetical protein
VLLDFVCFLRAVWRKWNVLLTGGSIIAFIAIYETVTGTRAPVPIGWMVLGATLVLAAFFAWRDEWLRTGKGFINLEPKELAQLIRNRTSAQRDALTKEYAGKRIKINGKLADVSHSILFPWLSSITIHADDGFSVYADVWRWRSGLYSSLNMGTMLTITGRIAMLESYYIFLTGCELIKIGDIAMPAPRQESTPDQ